MLFLAALVVAGCPGDRRGINTMRGNPADAPPAMRALAPPAQVVVTDLRKPESVLYDPEQDLYFISNVNGDMLTRDGNGFISRMHPDSMQVELKWIEGGKNGVTLDAPKGLAVLGDSLYVSDVGGVRRFDRRSGAPRGFIALPGAVFVNDLTTDGRSLYASDTGLRIGPGTSFIPSGTDAIWKITGDRAEKIAAGAELKHPNGLDFVGGKLRVVTFGANELYELDDGGKKSNVVELDGAQLDGLTHLADGRAVISSWEANEILRETGDGHFEPILAGTDTPADIGYDAKRGRLLVPHAVANNVTIHPLR